MELTRSEILRYVNLVNERRHLFIIISLCIMSLIVWGSYFLPKKYRATSIIFIERNVIEDFIQDIAITPSMDDRIKVLRDTMLSRSIVLDVLRKLDLDVRVKDERELEEMIIEFQTRTNILVKRSNSLINVSYVDRDPGLARNFVNSLVNEYVEKNIFAKREEAYDATKFLKKQVAFFKEKMDEGENAIVKFRQEQGVFVAMDERSVINEIRDHEKDIENIKIKRNELIATKASIEKQLAKEEPFTTIYSMKGSEDTIRALETRLRYLLIKYTENYPEVIKLKAEMELLKKQGSDQSTEYPDDRTESEISLANPMYQEFKQKVIETGAEIKSLNAKENHLMTLIKEKKDNLKYIPENQKKLADMEKQRAYYLNLYGKLLEKLGQSEVSKQMEIEDKSSTFRIIEPAILPQIPVSPNRKMLIFFGIIAGFAGGIGVIFFLDKLDNSIKTIDAIKNLGVPVLAIIPKIQNLENPTTISRKDMMIYSVAGLYMFCILGVLSAELLGFTYVDEFMSNIQISLKETIKGILS